MNLTQLDEMVTGYIQCALWSSTVDGFWDDATNEFVNSECDSPDSDPRVGYVNLDEFFSYLDISDSTLDKFDRDCREFVMGNLSDLATLDPAQCGHDFWLTRNGHGTGFWDRGLGELGDKLSDACRPYGECHLWYDEATGQIEYEG